MKTGFKLCVALALLLLPAAGCKSSGSSASAPQKNPLAQDLENLCRIATKLTEDKSLDPTDRSAMLAERINATEPSPQFRELMATIAQASPDKRYPLLLRAAKDVGLENWTCPVLDRPDKGRQ